MHVDTVNSARVHLVNSLSIRNSAECVVYWMQQAQRISDNHALEAASYTAAFLQLPLLIVFVLTDHFPEANSRHYRFMCEGLIDLHKHFVKLDASFYVLHGDPPALIKRISETAAIVFTDKGYLRIQKEWRNSIASSISCPLFEVETDVIVPLQSASDHEEFAARTYRPKLLRLLPSFINDDIRKYTKASPFYSPNLLKKSPELESTNSILSVMSLDSSVSPIRTISGGETAAYKLLQSFVNSKLADYADKHSNPTADVSSGLSPYLHFGHISPLTVLRKVMAANVCDEAKETFIEELFVRRELSMNFVFYNNLYDSFNGLPDWAKKTLNEHRKDPREYCYDLSTYEAAATHDPFWNAAQQQLIQTGTIHNYMRMYWGKKFIEWTASPEDAFNYALYLNNKYALDGRDPNSFTGIAWCFGKHDRPWAERPTFGKIRYMNANGLRRKFRNIDQYVDRWL